MSARLALVFLFSLACAAVAVRADEPHTVVFFGDSLTAGYGLDDPASEAYPALIQEKITAAKLPWRVVNAGLSGETTSGGLRRVEWILRQPVDLFVLALGANDGLRGIDPAVAEANLQGILAGMQMPPNYGEEYTRAFAAMYPALAKKNQLVFIPFLLANVGGHMELNQPDGMHPTAAGAAVVADTVWLALRPLL